MKTLQVLGFNLTESGLFCVLPWLTMAFSANLGGWIADTLVSKGYSVTTVRKVIDKMGWLGSPKTLFVQLFNKQLVCQIRLKKLVLFQCNLVS